ncbi:hypothetical protein T492DRAFT_873189 [Pavlovales sp. CCMP2436]|nr:hypothetical protein T492DRAFT_873189 [Pavlovales sp. CCMP2436]
MAALQRRLYGESKGGWDAEGRPSARELASHGTALQRDAVGGAWVLLLFGVSATLFADAAPSVDFLAAQPPGAQLARAAIGLLCAAIAWSALLVDLLLCPCPAVADGKYRAIRTGSGHYVYLTVQSLTIITTHLSLSALANAATDKLTAPLLPAALARACLTVHAACHVHAEYVASLSLVLALLYYPAAILLPNWEEEEVVPWRRRGVHIFKRLNFYSHGAAIPGSLLDLLILKDRHLLAQLAPPYRALLAVGICYGILYPISVHVGYNWHAMHARTLARERRARAEATGSDGVAPCKSHPPHEWPYGFMTELTDLGKPPAALHSWGVRPPFSTGWVLLSAIGTAAQHGLGASPCNLHRGTGDAY